MSQFITYKEESFLSVDATPIKENPKYSLVKFRKTVEKENQVVVNGICENSGGETVSDTTLTRILRTDFVPKITMSVFDSPQPLYAKLYPDKEHIRNVNTYGLIVPKEDIPTLKEILTTNTGDYVKYLPDFQNINEGEVFFFSPGDILLFDINENPVPLPRTFFFSETEWPIDELEPILKSHPWVLELNIKDDVFSRRTLKAEILLPQQEYENYISESYSLGLWVADKTIYSLLGIDFGRATEKQISRVQKIIDYFGEEEVEAYLHEHHFPEARLTSLSKDEAQKIITGMAHRIPKAIYNVHGRDSGPTLSM